MSAAHAHTGAPDMAVVAISVDLGGGVDAAWSAIGAFGDAGRFLDIPCRLIAGEGGVGSARLVGDDIIEIMVGGSAHSYTYAQTQGPMAGHAYHGCLSLHPLTDDRTRLSYTLSYDQSALDAVRRAEEHERIRQRFQGAAEAMRRVVEN